MKLIKHLLLIHLALITSLSYGARDGNGNYNLPAGNPVQSGTTISSSWANSTLSDVAGALSQSVSRDGQSPFTGNINAGGFVLKNLGNGTERNHSVNLGQIQDSGLVLLTNVLGSDTITANLNNLTTYVNGQIFNFKAVANNTGAVTININNIGAKSIFNNGIDLTAGTLQNGKFYQIIFDGTQFNLLGKNADPTKISKTGDNATGAYIFDYTGVSTSPPIKFVNSTVWNNTDPFTSGSFVITSNGQNNNQPLQMNTKSVNDATLTNNPNLLLRNIGGTGIGNTSNFQSDIQFIANNSTLSTVPENGKYEIHTRAGKTTGTANQRQGYIAIAPRSSDLNVGGRDTTFDEGYYFLPLSTVGQGLFTTSGNGIEISPKYNFSADARINLINSFGNSNLLLQGSGTNSNANLNLYANTGGASGQWHLQSNGTNGRLQIKDAANSDVSVLDISAVDDGLMTVFQRSDNSIGKIRFGNSAPDKIISVGAGNVWNFGGQTGLQMTVESGRQVAIRDINHISNPVSGSTVLLPTTSSDEYTLINNSATLASLTTTLPDGPMYGQRQCVSFRSGVTNLTVNSAGGATIYGGGTFSANAGNGICYIYYKLGNIWFREN